MEKATINFADLLVQAVNEPGMLSKAFSAFHNFSIGNIMAAAMQCQERGLELGPIASYKAWLDKGRQVQKGQKALILCMPIKTKVEKEDGTNAQIISRFLWKANWFVLSQTTGEDFKNEVVTPEWDKEKALKELDIVEKTFDYPDGNCQGVAQGNTIKINPLGEFPHKTRFHEIAHIVLGHTLEHTMSDDDRTPRDIREVEAEGTAYILTSLLQLPGLEESRGYIHHWMMGQAISEKSSQRIFSAANKILKAGSHQAAE